MFKTDSNIIFIFIFIFKMDKEAIINHCLKEFYIKENYNLNKLIGRYQILVRRMESQILTLASQVSRRNQEIANLQSQLRINNRIVVQQNNELRVFERDEDGIYHLVPEEPDSDETDDEPIWRTSEEAQDIARRLGFESDSSGYESDDLMDRLMGQV